MVIFRICLLKRANDPVVCKQRSFGVKTKRTFIVDQTSSKTKHSYDFDAKDSIGAAKKTGYVKFYKVERGKGNDNMLLSSEITPKYNSAGDTCAERINAGITPRGLPIFVLLKVCMR